MRKSLSWQYVVSLLAVGEPLPQPTGSIQSFTVTSGLNSDTTYYFALKTADESPNWSAISNPGIAHTVHGDPGGGGGGGDGGGSTGEGAKIFLTQFIGATPGLFVYDGSARSTDGRLNLSFPKGTSFKAAEGWSGSYITVDKMTTDKQPAAS